MERNPEGAQPMRKLIIVAVLAAAGLSAAACSREDRTDIKEGAVATGEEIKEAADDIVDNPEVKEAGAAVANAGEEAAGAVKEAAADVQDGVADASDEAQREADEARAAAGDTTRKQ
jgi:gas vesicle protein